MENGDGQIDIVIQDTRPEIIISEPVKHGDGTSGFISYLVSSNYSVTAFNHSPTTSFNHSPTTSTHLQVRRRYDELINL